MRTFKVVSSRSRYNLGCNFAQISISGHNVAPIGRNLDSKQPIEPSRGVYNAVTRFLMSLFHKTEEISATLHGFLLVFIEL